MNPIRSISPEEIDQAGPQAALIDVREPGEFAGKWLAGSVNIPMSRFDAGAAQLEKSKPVIVLCGRGRMAQSAAQRLQALGFSDIRVVLLGSALGWLAHPAFWLLSAGVGAGLVYSAATDTCGMAALLAWMPWNRLSRPQKAQATAATKNTNAKT